MRVTAQCIASGRARGGWREALSFRPAGRRCRLPRGPRDSAPRRAARALVLSASVVALATAVSAEPVRSDSRVVLLVMDDVTVRDLATVELPNFATLARKGGIGLLNTQSFSGSSFHRGCATIGAGARATGSDSVGHAYMSWETLPDGGSASAAYHRRTGRPVEGAEIVHLGLGPAQNDNARLLAPGHPGTLGQALADNGIERAVVGNSDTSLIYGDDTERREAVAIVMDTTGRVPAGEVSKAVLARDPTFPFGLRASRAAYAQAIKEHLGRARVLVVDVGDPFRAEAFRSRATAEQGQRLKEACLHAADALVGIVLSEVSLEHDLVLALAPSIPITERYQLAPILAAGPGIEPGTRLTSPSTRRRGVVTLMDVAPTVLSHLGVQPPPGFVGRPISSVRSRVDWPRLHTWNLATAATDGRIRRALLTPLGVWQGLVLCLLGLALHRRQERRLPGELPLRAGALSLTVVYLVVFVAKPLTRASLSLPELAIAAPLLATLLLSWLLARARCGAFQASAMAAAATLLAMTVDTFLGAPLSVGSTLGYSAYFGGRYYGVGNIVGCALIGSALLALAGWHVLRPPAHRGEWVGAGLLLLALSTVIGFPLLGANVGCAIASVTAFGTYLWVLSGRPVQARLLVALVAVVIGVLGAQVALDLRSGPERSSHLGQLVGSASTEGTSPVVQMVTTKIRVFKRSFRHYYWNFALLGSLLGCGLLWFGDRRDLVGRLRSCAPVRALVCATVVGGLVSLLLNDSGPACPAVITCFGLGGAGLWLLEAGPNGEGGRGASAS